MKASDMTTATLEPQRVARYWACPACALVTLSSLPDPMHKCSKIDGRTALMAPIEKPHHTPKARLSLTEREDFLGADVHRGADRYMNSRIDYMDGRNDLLVYAPAAHYDVRGLDASIGIGVQAQVAEARAEGSSLYHHRFTDRDLDRAARIARRWDAQNAWTVSGTYPYTLLQFLSKALSATADTWKALYYNNSVTPVNTATTALTSQVNGAGCAFQTANEQTTSGTYTAGTGMAVNTPAVNQVSNVLTFTATTITSATGFSTIALGLYGMVIADSTVSLYIASFNYFGGQQLVTSGTFAVTFASGFATYTC